MASPRPISPVPSFVFALRLICSTGCPAISRAPSRIAGKCGPSFGRSQNDDRIQMIDAQLRARREACACAREKSGSAAPFHFGSVSGKCVPMSPRPPAPRSASQSAWRARRHRSGPREPLSNGTSNAADHQLAAFGQAVQIVANAGASHSCAPGLSLLFEVESARGPCRRGA